MMTRKAFGKIPARRPAASSLPPVASAYAIAESTVREWVGRRAELTPAQRASAERIAAE